MRTPDRYVLDSFALLAYLEGEPGAAAVQALLLAASAGRAELAMTAVNLGEVAYIAERRKSLTAAQTALAAVSQLPIRLEVVDQALALEAAHVKACQRVSCADAFAIALARRLGAAVVTGDPEFATVEHLVAVRWLPHR